MQQWLFQVRGENLPPDYRFKFTRFAEDSAKIDLNDTFLLEVRQYLFTPRTDPAFQAVTFNKTACCEIRVHI
jgi:hypothetical protein